MKKDIKRCDNCGIEYPLNRFSSGATICKECNEKKILKILKVLKVVAILTLLGALADAPFSYYRVLRWIVCGVAGFSALIAVQRKTNAWIWIFGVIAVLFNPIFPLHFDRFGWQIIDVITAVIIFISVFEDPKKQQKIVGLIGLFLVITIGATIIIGTIFDFIKNPLATILIFVLLLLPFLVLYLIFGRTKL